MIWHQHHCNITVCPSNIRRDQSILLNSFDIFIIRVWFAVFTIGVTTHHHNYRLSSQRRAIWINRHSNRDHFAAAIVHLNSAEVCTEIGLLHFGGLWSRLRLSLAKGWLKQLLHLRKAKVADESTDLVSKLGSCEQKDMSRDIARGTPSTELSKSSQISTFVLQ